MLLPAAPGQLRAPRRIRRTRTRGVRGRRAIAGSRRPPRAAVGGQGFGAVWIGQFLIKLAETVALLYLYYYLQDVVHYRNPGQGQLILVLVATLADIVATVAVGRVADRSGGYRRYAVLASVLLAATGFVLAGFASWDLVIVCAFALGAGYGAFQSVSQALSLVVLPSQANAGRDLGIINIASSIPQVIGAPDRRPGGDGRGRLPRPVRLRRPAGPGRRRRLLPRPAAQTD